MKSAFNESTSKLTSTIGHSMGGETLSPGL